MNTKFVGIKDFRQNISEYAKKARSSNERYIIVNRNKPLFELKPFEESSSLDQLFADVIRAEKDIAQGKFYTEEEVLKELA